MDSTTLRQMANQHGKLAGMITEEAIIAGQDLASLSDDLRTLQAVAELCRRRARRQEARAAQADDKAVFCMGCQHRKDVPGGGIGCALELETKEACAKRRCGQYKAE